MSRMLAAAALAAVVSGCANMGAPPADEQVATAQAGYGRAFGRITYKEDGKEQEWGVRMLGLENHTLTLFVQPLPSGQMLYMSIDGKGDFTWPLLPGGYVIVAAQVRHTKGSYNQWYTGRLWTTFTVPAAGKAVYIGDLRIEMRRGASRYEVADRYEESLAAKQAAFQQAKFEPAKALMRFEPPLGTYKHVVGICNAFLWGISCNEHHRGVEPTQPPDSALGFPLVETLSPVLEWKPSTLPDVAYDVVIYESLSLTTQLGEQIDRLRGARVAYAEGLREPRFVPAAPLAPGKKYEWTVRVRQGDTVSDWSSASYSLDLLIAGRRGSGQNFGFATRDK